MILSLKKLSSPAIFTGSEIGYRNRAGYRTKLNTESMAFQVTSVSVSTEEDKRLVEPKKKLPNSLLLSEEENTVGIIGGLSAFSTLFYLEKLVSWSSINQRGCVPFIICSDPTIKRELLTSGTEFNSGVIVENLKIKRKFLEHSGARCIVMPCHVSHLWHREVSEGCSVTFLNAGDCVARELNEAKLRPLEAGSGVRIGILARDHATLMANFYRDKLQNEGIEFVLPDKPTMEHVVTPAVEAVNKKDFEGARNLLRVAIQILLVRAVNIVILASDEFQGLLPSNDPLLKKCIHPMDALAKSTVQWAQSIGKSS